MVLELGFWGLVLCLQLDHKVAEGRIHASSLNGEGVENQGR